MNEINHVSVVNTEPMSILYFTLRCVYITLHTDFEIIIN